MDKTLSPAISSEDEAKIASEIEDASAKIGRAIEQMRKDQREIDRLKLETRAMLKELMAA